MFCFLREHFQSKYLPYRMNRLESEMASFDRALEALSAKVDAILAVVGGDRAALEAAQAAVAAAESRAEAVVAEDAAQDAAQDAARADQLADVAGKLDAFIAPPPVVEAPVVEVPVAEEVVEVPVVEVPAAEEVVVPVDGPVDGSV